MPAAQAICARARDGGLQFHAGAIIIEVGELVDDGDDVRQALQASRFRRTPSPSFCCSAVAAPSDLPRSFLADLLVARVDVADIRTFAEATGGAVPFLSGSPTPSARAELSSDSVTTGNEHVRHAR